MELTIEKALQQGVAAHREGKLQDAERLYRAILQSQSAHPDANHNLGVLAVSANKADAALPLFETALTANPSIDQFWLSYIDALVKANRLNDAKKAYKKAKKQGVDESRLAALEAQLVPISQTKDANSASPSQYQISSLLEHYRSGRLSDAEKVATSISLEFPCDNFSWKILGAVFKATGRNSEALDANQKAVALSPRDAEAQSNLGVTLQEIGRLDEAEASLTRAVALKPDFAEAHYNLGGTFGVLRRFEEAEASYNRAIVLKPNYAEAYNNLANTLKELGRLDEAEENFKKAMDLKTDFKIATVGLGNVLMLKGYHKEGLDLIRQGEGSLFFDISCWRLI